jgi:hypothetical protein
MLIAALASLAIAAAPGPEPGAVELVDLRTECSKTYLLPTGEHQTSIFTGPIHVPEHNGRWRDYETDDQAICTTWTDEYWTGNVEIINQPGPQKISGSMQITRSNTSSAAKRAGWAKFDVTMIPRNSTITGAQLQYYNIEVDGSPMSKVTHCRLDPVITSDPTTLYNHLYDTTAGKVFCGLSDHTQGYWSYRNFNQMARDSLRNRLEVGWLAVGIRTDEGSPTPYTNAKMAGFNTGTYKPRLVVTFNPPPVDDPRALAVLYPTGVVVPDTVITPVAVCENLGNRLVSFDAYMLLTDPSGTRRYAWSEQVINLLPGTCDTIEFPSWNIGTSVGNWVARCSIYCSGDHNTGNNVIDHPFVVSLDGRIVDAGVVSIIQPEGWLDTCFTSSPMARFVNNGDMSINFSAWTFLANDSGRVYSSLRGVVGLPAGRETTLVFDEFSTGHITGLWNIACSTYAYGDTAHQNDALYGDFWVVYGGRPPWREGWVEVRPMPLMRSTKAVARGGWLALNPGDGFIYAAKGNKTLDFYRYDPHADTWTILASPLQDPQKGKMLDQGCRGVTDGSGCIYMVHGSGTTAFWQYSIENNQWGLLPDVPLPPSGKGVKGGSDLAYVEIPGVGRYVYLLKGDRCDFMRFNILTNEWEGRADAPPGIKARYQRDSWLAFDGANAIYAHKARVKAAELWKYDVIGDSWYTARLNAMPLVGKHGGRMMSKKSGDGSAGAYSNGLIWALKGGNTQQFFQYNVALDSWYEKDTIPSVGATGKRKRVKIGADLISYGGGAFFALKGNKTHEMWRYLISTGATAGGAQAGVTLEPAGRPSLAVGPNPLTVPVARVRYSLSAPGPARLAVYDAIGRCRYEQRFAAECRGLLSTDLRTLSNGVYLLTIETPRQSLSTKLVVRH